MWMVWLLGFFLFAVPAIAEPGFDQKYERDYNIFNPSNQYRPDTPLNPAQTYALANPHNPSNRHDPVKPVTRTKPKNPRNALNPPEPHTPNNPHPPPPTHVRTLERPRSESDVHPSNELQRAGQPNVQGKRWDGRFEHGHCL